MDINKHIAFMVKKHYEFYQYLSHNDFKFSGKEDDLCVSLDILESDSKWKLIEDYVQKNITVLETPVFSKEELCAAEWLKVRSKWHNGYPQPEADYKYEKGITYTRENFCENCGRGLYQIGDFRISKQPNWGRRYFFMLNWVFDEMFVSNTTRHFLEKNNVSGLHFREVKNKCGDVIFEDVWQMEIPYTLQPGIVPMKPMIENVYICPVCGGVKYHTKGVGILTYKREVFEGAPDFVKSEEIFGYNLWSAREIFIKQSVYKMLTENKMDRSLVFEPIQLV